MAAPVLLVHDDIATIATVRRLLAREGYEVILATSAADALIAFGHYLPGLIILAPGVESGRGRVIMEELAQHPDGKLARVLLLGESIPGFGAPVAPLPLDGASFLQMIQDAFRAGPDGQGWQVMGEHHADGSGELAPAIPPEAWRAAAPPEVTEQTQASAEQTHLEDEDWGFVDVQAKAALDETHREIEAEAIASIDSNLTAPPSAPSQLDSDLDALEDEVRAEAAERRAQRDARKVADEAARSAPDQTPEASWFDEPEPVEGGWAPAHGWSNSPAEAEPAAGARPLDESSFADLNSGSPAPLSASGDAALSEAPEAAEDEVSFIPAPPENGAPPAEESADLQESVSPDGEQAAEGERPRQEAEAAARLEAEQVAEREFEEQARQEAEAAAVLEAEQAAEREIEEQTRQAAREAERAAEREIEERARQEADAAARREAEQAAVRELEAAAAERAQREQAQLQAERAAREASRRAASQKARLEADAQAEREAGARAEAEQKAQAEIERLEGERAVAREEADLRAREAAEHEEAARRATDRAQALAERELVALAAAAKAREVAETARREAEVAAQKLKVEADQALQASQNHFERAEEQARTERRARERLEAELVSLRQVADAARADAERAQGEAEEASRRAAEEHRFRQEAERARDEAKALSVQAVIPLVVGRDALSVSMGGAVELTQLAELVIKLCRARVETRLELKAGNALRILWLQRGALVGATSSVPQESLLDRARRDGLIGKEQEAELRLLRAAPGGQVLEALRSRGHLRESEVVPLVQRQAEQIALEALSEPECIYRLAPEPTPSDVPTASATRPLLHLLAEALRRALDPEVVLSKAGGLRAVPVSQDGPLDDKAFGFSEKERRVMAAADGETTLEELLLTSGLRQEAALKLLGVAQVLGLLRIPVAERAAEAPSPDLDLERLSDKFEQIQEGDYFSILGLPRSAGGEEVHRAYSTLAAEFHPLKFAAHPDPALQHRARQIHEALAEAAHVLQDDRLRAEYARHLVD